MFCCGNCIDDQFFTNNVIKSIYHHIGRCDFCGASEAHLITPEDLSVYFELVISIYTEDSEGRLLVEWLNEDWGIFNADMDIANRRTLLAEILNNGEIVRKYFSPSLSAQSSSVKEWQDLRNELLSSNRFFPDPGLDLENLEALLAHLVLSQEEIPDQFFRARVHEEVCFSVDDMGAPPARKASHGRANPAGIPYLYLASDEQTAISEIRPHTGESISVGKFITPNNLGLVDLRNPRKTTCPFLMEDETEIANLRGDLFLSEKLGEELTRPVLPQSAAIDYIPSQYLCEFVKKCGFDGVVYKSSVSDGMNVALFAPNEYQCVEVHSYQVDKVTVGFTEI